MAFTLPKSLSKTLKSRTISILTGTRPNQVPPFVRSFSPLSTLSQSQEEKVSSRWSKWLLFLPGAITFGLGTWQILRRQEKIHMLEYRMKRLEMDPIIWNHRDSSSRDFDSLEFRKVLCKGFFDESKSIFVGPRSRSISGVTENGYFIITPFMPVNNVLNSAQSPILVNRGWVPRSWRDNFLGNLHGDSVVLHATPDANTARGRRSWWQFWSKKSKPAQDKVPEIMPVEVSGVVRGSEKPSIFVPANDSTSGQWFYVDVPGIAHACGLPADTLYIEDINENASASQPYPVPKDVNTLIRYSVMPQDHLNYTLTWYSLSAAVTFMAIKRLKAQNRFSNASHRICADAKS